MIPTGPIQQGARAELELDGGERGGRLSALWIRPEEAHAVLVLAHGAGAGMRHPFMDGVAERLADRAVATLRYQFPFMERGGRPDSPVLATHTVRAAVDAAARLAPDLPRFAGGKSFGGRMTSLAQSSEPLPGVQGILFMGFPLHPPGKPNVDRSEHLRSIQVPLLFLQGSRDTLCHVDRLGEVLKTLGRRASLHLWDAADHSFHVPKSSGRSDDEILDQMADAIAAWMRRNARR